MKKLILLFVTAASLSLSGCSMLSNIAWNEADLQQALGTALTGLSISDAQIIALSRQTVMEMDAKNQIENGPYMRRLTQVLSGITDVEGIPISFKVYKTDEVNAFACGDGSIRVYTGLMDLMDDEELLAVIGHEMGHVAHQDTKRAMKNAYLTAAARGAIGAAGSVGQIAKTALGDIGEMYVSSQFSQRQELKADEYGFKVTTEHGRSPYAMFNSLVKLTQLGPGSHLSVIEQAFSSHPDSELRAARMKEKADAYVNKPAQ